LEKAYGVNEDGEDIFEGYDLVDLEAKDREGISRIMGNICERFNLRIGILITLVGECLPSKSNVVKLVEGECCGIDYN
jgi:hypothetical protein